MSNGIIKELKKRNIKITKARKEIIKILFKSKQPLDVQTIISKMTLEPNKTTVYRQVNFLLGKQIIKQINFGDKKKRYEIELSHHHHLICVNCKAVKEIKMNNELREREQEIEKDTRFKIMNHSLEFFGICRNCQF